MPGLVCYWLKTPAAGVEEALDAFVDATDTASLEPGESTTSLESFGPVTGNGFRAKLFLTQSTPYPLPWAEFLQSHFAELSQRPVMPSPAALLIMEVLSQGTHHYFGFAFGFGGRHLLRTGVWHRGYGLRTALNLIYPTGADSGDMGRLIAVDAKTRSSQTIRSRRQASHATTLESFDVDRLRDVVGGASGRSANRDLWGTRVTGGDAIYLNLDLEFEGLPDLCHRLLGAHLQTDYQERFAWLDDLQPVADRDRIAILEARVLRELSSEQLEHLDFSPPEIVDWTRVDGFRYHYERNTLHPDLRLEDYLRGLRARRGNEAITVKALKARFIFAIDSDGRTVHRWSVWRCLVGELSTSDGTVILDEGEFFDVSGSYLNLLDAYIASLPGPQIGLPTADGAQREGDYNRLVSTTIPGCLLLDQKNIVMSGQTTPIEICDILTANREFVHVKRHLGSSDLSHLFAQGAVSAGLMHDDVTFRSLARERVRTESGDDPVFQFIDPGSIRPDDFMIVYAVIANWKGRPLERALPFFSKVNLRKTATELQRRGYRVAFAQVATTS